jgi:hypothetical protein
MLPSRNSFKCVPWRRRARMGCFQPANASEHRHSDVKRHFLRAGQPVQTALSGSIRGRSSPRQGGRRELQAMSNSLQLTSR